MLLFAFSPGSLHPPAGSGAIRSHMVNGCSYNGWPHGSICLRNEGCTHPWQKPSRRAGVSLNCACHIAATVSSLFSRKGLPGWLANVDCLLLADSASTLPSRQSATQVRQKPAGLLADRASDASSKVILPSPSLSTLECRSRAAYRKAFEASPGPTALPLYPWKMKPQRM